MTLRRSVASNWAGMLVTGAVSFLIAPLMIHRLGATFFGLWILVSSLVDYSGLLDNGMRVALFHHVACALGAEDRRGRDRTLVNALAIALGCALLMLLMLPGLVWCLPHLFPHAAAQAATLRATCALLGLSLAVLFPARALGSYISASRRFDLYNLGTVAATLLRNGLIALFLLRGYGVVAVAAAALTGAVFALLANTLLLRYADPGLHLDWRQASWGEAGALFRYGCYAFVNFCGESLRSCTDAIVIARVLAMALVTPFNIASRLIEYSRSTLGAAASPLLGRMSEMQGGGEAAGLRICFLRSTRWFAVAGGLFGIVGVCDASAFIRLWIGPGYEGSAHLLAILVYGYVFSFAQLPSQLVLFATKRHRFLAMLTIVEGLANLALSVVWGRRYGLVGIAWGTTVPLLLASTLVLPWYVLRAMNISLARYLGRALAAPAAAVGVAWLLLRFAHLTHPAAGLAPLAATAALQFVVVLAVSAGFVLDAPERRWLAAQLSGCLGRTASKRRMQPALSATEPNP